MSDREPLRGVWGLVPAGGRGERFGSETPKQFTPVAGRPLLAWTLGRILDAGVAGITVALPQAQLEAAAGIMAAEDRITWVAGGANRQESVAACLATCPENVPMVLVHDGARPAVALEDLRATLVAASETDADGAILARPVADTLKQVKDGLVTSTVDRTGLFRAETPQVFKTSVLKRALDQCRRDGFVGTDEASLVERVTGASIRVVLASQPNPKLTHPDDLPLVRLLLQGEAIS